MPTYNAPRKPRPVARPKYTVKPTPRRRGTVGSQLPSGRARQQRRKGGAYLKRSQGFGGGARRRGGRGYGQNSDPRRVYALIIVGCALLLFAASILWYANRGVDITLNGETASVRIGSTVERIISDQGLEPKPGDLLAVDDTVLTEDAGEPYTVRLDGKKVKRGQIASIEIEGGEELEILDGDDVYEKHEVQATSIEPKMTVKGKGPLAFVETWGEAGRSEIWVGEQTGKTADKGIVKEPVDCVVMYTTVTPDKDDGKYVALTFDEGPSARTEELLAILKDKGAKATFFVSGDKVQGGSAAVKAIVESGNELGTNAMSDTRLTELSGNDLRSQISSSFDAVQSASGERVSLLRPPFGEFSEKNWAESMDLMSAVVTWSIDSGDWMLKGSQSVVDTVVSSVRNGSIVLMTDNDATASQSVEALPQIIDQLLANGYTFVTLSELIATDEDLDGIVTLGKVSMPKGATLPKIEENPSNDAPSE